MKKWLKALSVLAILILLATSTASANPTAGSIPASLNSVKVKINGTLVGMDNILFEETLYVPLRIISQIYDKGIEWDDSTRTVNITDNTANTGKKAGAAGWRSIAYQLALAFMISGILLLLQAGFLRSTKNIKQLARLSQQNNGISPSVKRILQEKCTCTYGFYYLLAGLVLQFLKGDFVFTPVKIAFIAFVSIVLWLGGIWLARSSVANQYPEILNTYTRTAVKEEVLANMYTGAKTLK